MKKALVILLALTMVLSCMAIVPFGASAEDELAVGAVAEDYKPEGTAVSTAAEFAGMAADGTYYLAADITLDATYAANFTGTLDGNGKVITTKVPVFDQFNGTAMNLTLKGYVEVAAETTWKSMVGNVKFAGVFANAVGTTADTSITNVRNEATITSTVVGLGGIAGIAGINAAKTTTTFTNCVNYGFIDKGKNINVGASAGILAHAEADASVVGVEFVDCANYGDVVAYARIGGVAGAILCSANFVDCVNEGDVESINSCAGGVVGRITSHSAAYVDKYLFENCVNRGDITAYTADCGGVIGLCGSVDELTIKGCENYGDVQCSNLKATVNMGGIIAETAVAISDIVVENCVNYGNIGVEADATTTRTAISRAGGIAGQITTKDGGTLSVSYCYNYGDIYAKLIAGGVAGVGMGSGGTGREYSYIACGNFGKVTCATYGDENTCSRVGGIVGHFDAGVWGDPYVAYCFNYGEVVGNGFVSGIVGYSNCVPRLEYNISAGELTSTRAIVHVENGDTVGGTSGQRGKNITTYSYTGANGVTRYFRAPIKGTVAISGDTVTFTADAAYAVTKEVQHGDVVAWRNTYTFKDDNGKYYAFYAIENVNAPVNIDTTGDFPVVTVGGYTASVIEWPLAADNKTVVLTTYDHPLNTSALISSDTRSWEVDLSKNVILEGVADMASMQGFGEKWWNMPTLTKDYVGTPEADFTSGKVAGELNAMSGENIFRQNLNAQLFEVDAYPTTDATHAKVVNIGGVYGNQLFDVENDAGSPATGDAIVYVVVALAVSTISLAAVAVCKKIKEN